MRLSTGWLGLLRASENAEMAHELFLIAIVETWSIGLNKATYLNSTVADGLVVVPTGQDIRVLGDDGWIQILYARVILIPPAYLRLCWVELSFRSTIYYVPRL